MDPKPFGDDAFMNMLFYLGCDLIFNPKPDDNEKITSPGDARVDAPGTNTNTQIAQP